MSFDAALIKEQGVTFAVVVVNRSAVINNSTIVNTQNSFSNYFPAVPIILMVQDSRGIPTYYGRTDIVKYLARIHPSRLPFKRYTA